MFWFVWACSINRRSKCPNYRSLIQYQQVYSTTSSVSVSAGPNGIGSNTGIVHSAGDQDWFRISLRAGELYQFQLNSTSGVDPTLALRNAAGVQVAFDDDSGPGLNSLLTFRAPTAGNYYLDAGGYCIQCRILFRRGPRGAGDNGVLCVGRHQYFGPG